MDAVLDGYRPGALAQLVALQTSYYARELGFGLPFETRVASEMAAFLRRFNPAHDLFRLAWGSQDAVLGGITLDGGDAEAGLAHLRWFIMADAARGQGLGRRLLEEALRFAHRSGADGVFLTTVQGLNPARHLYEQAGFVCVQAQQAAGWGRLIEEQRWELRFSAAFESGAASENTRTILSVG
jgi:GNAT superfamily N-acetyltransferase